MKLISKKHEVIDANDDLSSAVNEAIAQDVNDAKRREAVDLKMINEVAAALGGDEEDAGEVETVDGAEDAGGEGGFDFPEIDFGEEPSESGAEMPPADVIPGGEMTPGVEGAVEGVEEEKAISLSQSALSALLTCIGEKAKEEWSEAEVAEIVDRFIGKFGGVGDLTVITPEDVEAVCAEEAEEEATESPEEKKEEAAGGPPAEVKEEGGEKKEEGGEKKEEDEKKEEKKD